MSLRDELQAIYHQRGALNPTLVVDTARNSPESRLHQRFQWDDTVAGENYRLLQAQALIRSVRIVYKTDAKGVEQKRRAFVSTGQHDRPSDYLPTDEALADPFTHDLVLRQFERAILALRRQYGHLKEYDAMMLKLGLGQTQDDVA
jgi:hypothetical protein